MKPKKRTIHIVRHLPTGAEVPMIVNKVSDENIVEDYKELMEDRKGFTISMLEDRWDMSREEVISLLQKFQVPAHVSHKDVRNIDRGKIPLDIAFFFEEYVYGIEKKSKIPHSKLKSKARETISFH